MAVPISLLLLAQTPAVRTINAVVKGQYEAVVKLPRLGKGIVDRAVTSAMDTYAGQRIEALKQSVRDPETKEFPHPFSLDIRPHSVYRTGSLTSVALEIYTYSGGAHGMTVYRTFTYAVVQGKAKKMTLGAFFRPGSDYRGQIGLALMDKLRVEERATWVQTGEVRDFTAAQLENFTVSKDGLRFFFPPYDLGPYAAGPFIINLSSADLGPDFQPKTVR